MATTTETHVLTRDDLKALRQADTVSFHHYHGKSCLSATKRVRKAGPFDDQERRYEVACASTFSGICDAPGQMQCFAMEYSSAYSIEWRTIVGCLKVGDEVTLHWWADGYRSGYVERARVTEHSSEGGSPGLGMTLHADALYLKVRRQTRGGKTVRLGFLVTVSICPDNTARMIRV